MTIAKRFAEELINQDKRNAKKSWNSTPNISISQQTTFMESENREFHNLTKKYPHKLIAVCWGKDRGNMTLYDIKRVFEDGSEDAGTLMPLFEVENMKGSGVDVEIVGAANA